MVSRQLSDEERLELSSEYEQFKAAHQLAYFRLSDSPTPSEQPNATSSHVKNFPGNSDQPLASSSKSPAITGPSPVSDSGIRDSGIRPSSVGMKFNIEKVCSFLRFG